MMTSGNLATRYRTTQLVTADRGHVLTLMFDGGLRFLRGAEDELRADNFERFGDQLSRAQAVISELLHTLDHKQGGEIAANLERLYQFMLEHLVEANLQKSPAHVGQVRRVFEIVAGAYREILDDRGAAEAAVG